MVDENLNGGLGGRDAAERAAAKPSRWRAAITDFINNMDARAWRAVVVTTVLLAVVFAALVIGRLIFGQEIEHAVRGWLGDAERAHWGLPAAILAFTLAAFVGAPQFVLIAACVLAFGPEVGFWYAWIATMASGVVTYFAGRFGGAAAMQSYRGATGGRFTRFIGRNGFLASFVVRFLPTAPFVVVNMAMGAARVGFLPFFAGLALGVLPKTAIVAFAGDGIMDAAEGKLGMAALAGVLAIGIWFLAVLVVRRIWAREESPKD